MDDESVPQFGDEPLDLSTPVVEPRVGKATIPLARPGASTGWDAKVGVDYRSRRSRRPNSSPASSLPAPCRSSRPASPGRT